MEPNRTDNKIILVDKPKGISSFGVIRLLRKKYNIKKMGHAGTLDPLATGLMIIATNKETKNLTNLIGLNKVYEVEILLGKKTTTADMEGEVIEDKPISELDENKLKNVLSQITGKINLPVPAFSAIKVNGNRLYKLARENKEMPELPVKQMEIFWIKNNGVKKDGNYLILNLEMEVKSGTYIRSIAEEIGKLLEIPATIKELRRIKIGDFKIEDAEKI